MKKVIDEPFMLAWRNTIDKEQQWEEQYMQQYFPKCMADDIPLMIGNTLILFIRDKAPKLLRIICL